MRGRERKREEDRRRETKSEKKIGRKRGRESIGENEDRGTGRKIREQGGIMGNREDK